MACELGGSQSGKMRQLDYQRNYYEQYIAVSGARIYNENRTNSHTRDHPKYSVAFLAALGDADVFLDCF
ncbi:hypothetical protein ACFSR0_10585 [Enterococcus camelliae]|uniref:Uncharacterized protein n=1 Tax=Enterococcus camelliae TaxID=453959 RepID=A0ABW5TLL9_9ENTE